MALSQGDQAPNVELMEGGPDERVQLEDLRGDPVVLFFFPMAFTSVCTDEMCTLSDDSTAYADLDARVYGISVDSPFSQNAWKKQEGIEIPLLSDFNREAIEAFDVRCEDLIGLRGVANRSAFVIDAEGTIQYSWESDDPRVLPDFDEIKTILREMRG